MRDSIKKHQCKKEKSDVKKEEFEKDKKKIDTSIEEQLDTFADIIVAFLLKENYDDED